MIAGEKKKHIIITYLFDNFRKGCSRRVWYSILHATGFPWLGLRSCKDKADLPQDIFQPSYLISPR